MADIKKQDGPVTHPGDSFPDYDAYYDALEGAEEGRENWSQQGDDWEYNQARQEEGALEAMEEGHFQPPEEEQAVEAVDDHDAKEDEFVLDDRFLDDASDIDFSDDGCDDGCDDNDFDDFDPEYNDMYKFNIEE